MITVQNKTFKLDTHETTYLFRVLPGGQLEQLYYGRYITGDGDTLDIVMDDPISDSRGF